MARVAAVAAGLLTLPVLLALAPVVLAAGAAGGPAGLSPLAREEVPAALLPVYRQAAEACPGLPWTVLAAIGKVESDHARLGGARLASDGEVRPWIIGPPLDGTAGTRRIEDTDAGRWDHDQDLDRAVGPMQFLPTTWRRFGLDASGDGRADPHNALDAIHAAASYLCANGADTPAALWQAVWTYNHDADYVEQVLELAGRYAAPTHAARSAGAGRYAWPVDTDFLDRADLTRPHHDYPAWDLPLPVGTSVFAVHGGTVVTVSVSGRCGNGVVVAGTDGNRYTYCHATQVLVERGEHLDAGQLLALSGTTGRSTGPHLHLEIRTQAGRLVCPQQLLQAWRDGHLPAPETVSSDGCVAEG